MEIVVNVIIALATTTLGSILAYLKAVKESNSKIEAIKISSNTELEKIREESKKELDRIKVETDETIRLKIAENELEQKNKDDALKNKMLMPFVKELMSDPKGFGEKLKDFQDLSKTIKKD